MSDKPAFQRVLLKLSGEALLGDLEYGTDGETVDAIAEQLKRVRDRGVEVAVVLGAGNISIASVLQHEPLDGKGIVPLVIMTHEATEGAIARACATIDRLPAVQSETVHMWVRD